ncbi:MAG: phage major capsid protein [Planctomycetota bacterium]|jgi:hypothetical protein
MVAINYRDLKRQIELDGPQRSVRFIREGLNQEWFTPEDFSIRQLAEATVPDGREFVSLCNPSNQQTLWEAAGGMVDTATFSNITGQIVYNKILGSYDDPGFIWPQLVDVTRTEFSGEKIPGVGEMGDDMLRVGEGQDYPLVGLEQMYIETPETVKYGMVVPVTKEAIFFDRTNLVLQRAARVGYWAGVRREKEVIKIVCGVDNNYKKDGTSSDTYKTSGGHGVVNSITDALADWTDINAALQKFAAMTDFMTGESIIVLPKVLLVGYTLVPTAHYILNSTQIRGGTSNADPSYQTLSTDPTRNMAPRLQLITSVLIESLNSSETNDWWIGDPKKAFTLMENWGITQQVAPANSEWAFMRDIVQRYKVSERSVAAVTDPHFMIKSTGGS